MTDTITLPRAVGEKLRERLYAHLKRIDIEWWKDADRTALNALDDALAEPELQKERPDFLAGYDAGLADGRRCAERDAQDARDAAIVAAALAEPKPDAKREFATDALRRWANTDDGPPKTKWQGGYDAARRWVREVALPALAEPKKERAETGIPARSVGVGSGETDPSRGEAYREHVTDGSFCWCNPELNYRDPDTGAELWIHRREQ